MSFPQPQPFELEWFGGMPEARLRRRRGDVDALLPWGTLDTSALSPTIVEAARRSYTEGAWNEYRTAAAFAELSRTLLRARAPIDLIALAADFVVDEMGHVELNARMAMELGGATPMFVDCEEQLIGDLDEQDAHHRDGNPRRVPEPSSARTSAERAVEIAVRVSCVGEALSGPLLAIAARAATHPLTKGVLRRLASEEGAHGAIGWMVLDWARERGIAINALRLARIAGEEIDALFEDWSPLADVVVPSKDDERERHASAACGIVGFASPASFLGAARHALRQRVAAPLALRGIVVDAALLDRLAPPPSPPSDVAG